MADWLGQPQAATPRLDCDRCSKSLQSASAKRWQDWKCCAFQPFVPNYSLGKFLEEGGQLPTLNWDHLWLPIGLVPGTLYRDKYSRTDDDDRGEDLKCAFYQERRCAIWSSRPSECSTFFCEGRTPEIAEISNTAFRVETTVAQLALLHLGYSEADIFTQIDVLNGEDSLETLDPLAAGEIYRRCWRWAGQEGQKKIRRAVEAL